MSLRELKSDEHVTATVRVLEQALEDAKAGKLSTVIIFGDLRGTDEYRFYKSASQNYLEVVGKLTQVIHDMCKKH